MNQAPRIGIVGGGQLGKMLVQAAKKLGFFVAVTDPTPESPAGQLADTQIVGDYKDEKVIRQLAEVTDFITFEIELANDAVLLELMQKGKSVNPSPETLGIIRDKLNQKKFLRKYRIPTAPFLEIPISHSGKRVPRAHPESDPEQARMTLKESIEYAAKKFGYPVVLKTRTDAYDGRGNFVIRTKKDIDKGLKALSERLLYVEQFIPFKKELAIMIARREIASGTSRSTKKEIAVYPVVETTHVNNICDTVIAPAPISEKAKKNAAKLAIKTMKHLRGAGVFGIEMFLIKDDNILINEIAPRVHNSGHYSIEACVTSQFEQHIRAISGLPLGSTRLIPKAVVVKNILGKQHGSGFPKGLEKALRIPEISVHLYGKAESRPQRKMGHITVVGDTVTQCLRKANKARRMLIV